MGNKETITDEEIERNIIRAYVELGRVITQFLDLLKGGEEDDRTSN